jgi:hypothetical protein
MTRFRPTAALPALLVANVLPLIGVFLAGWDVTALVLLYWAENGIVGAMTVLKMLTLRESSFGNKLAVVCLTIPFTCAHYGGFWIMHGFALIHLFKLGGLPPEVEMLGEHEVLEVLLAPLVMARNVVAEIWGHRPYGLEWGLACLGAGHVVSFAKNFIAGGERARLAAGQLMVHPYLRVFLGTVVVLAGGWAAESGTVRPGVAVLSAIVLLKLVADTLSYLVSHGRRRAT